MSTSGADFLRALPEEALPALLSAATSPAGLLGAASGRGGIGRAFSFSMTGGAGKDCAFGAAGSRNLSISGGAELAGSARRKSGKALAFSSAGAGDMVPSIITAGAAAGGATVAFVSSTGAEAGLAGA